jgi:hypothetical protein
MVPPVNYDVVWEQVEKSSKDAHNFKDKPLISSLKVKSQERFVQKFQTARIVDLQVP